MSDPDWQDKSTQVELLSTELDREIQSYEARNDAMQGRATILVAAASVVGTLQVAIGSPKAVVFDLIASALAAVIGLLVAAPIGTVVLNLNVVEKRLLSLGIDEGRATLLDKKIAMLNTNQHRLNIRGLLTLLGFLLLVLALVSSFWTATHPTTPPPTRVVIVSHS